MKSNPGLGLSKALKDNPPYAAAGSPGTDKESNWLPCPFKLTIGVYQPKQELLDGPTKHNIVVTAGSQTIPPVKRVE
jgi:hypothetical protein